MNKIVITGGAGFIGSHVVEKAIERYPDSEILILDKMTYAADFANVSHLLQRGRRHLHVGDLCDFELCLKLTVDADVVLHVAAESHVDNSFGNSLRFTQSNALGTHTLLEACRVNGIGKFIHVSTDEVYGEIHEGLHVETDFLDPTNPYSASKAAADMIVNSYVRSFKMPIVTARANNIYGIRQYPEKLIPRFILLGLTKQKFTVHGSGANSRRFLAAEDFAEALLTLVDNGKNGEIYNIGSDTEYTNLQIVDLISTRLGIDPVANTEFVADRPFNDSRYAIDSSKIHSIGWHQKRRLEDHLDDVIYWYRENFFRYEHLFQASTIPAINQPSLA